MIKEDLMEFIGGLSNGSDDILDLIKYLTPFKGFGCPEDLLVEQAINQLESARDLIEEAIDTVGKEKYNG